MGVPGKLTPEKLEELYSELSKEFEEDAVERSDGEITRKGYNTTGYKAQFLTNRLNEVLGLTHWRRLEQPMEVSNVTIGWRDGKPVEGFNVVAEVIVQFGNWLYDETGKVIEFQVLAQASGIGEHRSKNRGDAYKGAYTNGFKKAVAQLGVGRQAYEGSIDDDNLSPEGNSGAKTADGGGQPRAQQGAPRSTPSGSQSRPTPNQRSGPTAPPQTPPNAAGPRPATQPQPKANAAPGLRMPPPGDAHAGPQAPTRPASQPANGQSGGIPVNLFRANVQLRSATVKGEAQGVPVLLVPVKVLDGQHGGKQANIYARDEMLALFDGAKPGDRFFVSGTWIQKPNEMVIYPNSARPAAAA